MSEPTVRRSGPEQTWELGPGYAESRHDLRAWLAETGTLPPGELLEAVQADQLRRWRHGQRVPVEAYLQLCPSLRDNPEAVLDLVVAECLLREEAGDRPAAAEYRWRCPDHAAQIEQHFELNAALLPEPAATAADAKDPPASWPRCPATRSRKKWGRAAWAWCTGPATRASTAWWP
jgi:hypothetical protein